MQAPSLPISDRFWLTFLLFQKEYFSTVKKLYTRLVYVHRITKYVAQTDYDISVDKLKKVYEKARALFDSDRNRDKIIQFINYASKELQDAMFCEEHMTRYMQSMPIPADMDYKKLVEMKELQETMRKQALETMYIAMDVYSLW
ncbi:hypothetical protein K0U07_05780 [bacterium]|nr:hypothetical protein [bacterium]